MSQSRLHDLIALAREPSSERRRQLLREVTDLFFASSETDRGEYSEMFDAVLGQLAGDMEEAVRAELAARMAEAEQPPAGLMRSLSQDAIAVAAPVLTGGTLSVDDQIAVARTQGQDHLRALSQRRDVAEPVTHEIAQRADDDTLGVLLRNGSARLSRQTHEIAVERAAANRELHEAVVDRASLPADLLNEMYFVVEGELRKRIMARNADLPAEALEEALAAGRKQVAARDGALPADYASVEAEVRALHARGGLTPAALAAMLRAKEQTRFLVSLCELADIDFYTARWILEREELDALAIVCKAADFDRNLFLTFAILILGAKVDAMGQARQYGELYAELPRDSAQRTIRFWRMRRVTGGVRAA